MFADIINNSLTIYMSYLPTCYILIQIELNIALFKVMIMDFNMASDLLGRHIQMPIR
jgi:hypothetical protein